MSSDLFDLLAAVDSSPAFGTLRLYLIRGIFFIGVEFQKIIKMLVKIIGLCPMQSGHFGP